MHEMGEKGFQAKEALNIERDASKLKDLDYLKSQEFPGPLTTSEDVHTFCELDIPEKHKQDRLYIEVRYAKATCLSLNTKSLFSDFDKAAKKCLPMCMLSV